jgi:hypothetical protein
MGEDAVFEAVRDLVTAGDYLDDREVKTWPLGVSFVSYRRGSAEHLSACREGVLEPLPALVPALAEAVEEAEGAIGFRIPRLLRRLYLEVANGGFGPCGGIPRLSGGPSAWTVLGFYRQTHPRLPDDGEWSFLPSHLLPLCGWGCGIYSFVDWSDPAGPVWGFDPTEHGDERGLFPEPFALAGWFARWMDGTLNQPCIFWDPVTGQWRGARDEDWAGL